VIDDFVSCRTIIQDCNPVSFFTGSLPSGLKDDRAMIFWGKKIRKNRPPMRDWNIERTEKDGTAAASQSSTTTAVLSFEISQHLFFQ